jgi:hypothetical protein
VPYRSICLIASDLVTDNKVEDDLKDTAGTTGSFVKVKHTEHEEERLSLQL